MTLDRKVVDYFLGDKWYSNGPRLLIRTPPPLGKLVKEEHKLNLGDGLAFTGGIPSLAGEL